MIVGYDGFDWASSVTAHTLHRWDALLAPGSAASYVTNNGCTFAAPGALGYGKYLDVYGTALADCHLGFSVGLSASRQRIIQFHFKIRPASVGISRWIMRGVNSGTPQWNLWYNGTTHFLELWDDDNDTLLATGAIAVDSGWHYARLKCTTALSGDADPGAASLDIYGVTEFALSGVDLACVGNEGITHIEFHGYCGADASTQHSIYIDNVLIIDPSTGTPTDWLPEMRVQSLKPIANDSVAWTPSTGSNYQNVDEETPDDDTSYNHAAVVGALDLFQFETLVAPYGVTCLDLVNISRKDNAYYSRGVALSAKVAGSTTHGSDNPLNTAYEAWARRLQEKPAGGAWTVAEVNASRFGVKVSS